MTKVFVFYTDKYGSDSGMEPFDSIENAADFISRKGLEDFSFTVIEGVLLKVVPVEVVKQVKLEKS